MKSGQTDLPLHTGNVPYWLANRMKVLGGAIVESLVHHYGRSEVLTRMSDPFWFQALGCVMGMDWHSSGITTSVLGALKKAVNPKSHDHGIYICGGRGRHALNTPRDIEGVAEKTGLDGEELVRASRLCARVDNNALQDGFKLYLHGFVLTRDGEWAIIQQGMNEKRRLARRYHWHSPAVRSFTSDPQKAIVGRSQGQIINLVHHAAEPAQQSILELCRQHPEKNLNEIKRLVLPHRHHVEACDINLKRLGAVLAVAHERELNDFASLLLTEGLGAQTMQSLALVSEIVHGSPTRFHDPARFAFAHGGKDGHPFPVKTEAYDQTIHVLKESLNEAKIGNTEKMEGIRRLNHMVNQIEVERSPKAHWESLGGSSATPR